MESTNIWGSIQVDAKGTLIDMCKRFCKHFNINREEWIGQSLNKIIQGEPYLTRNKVIFGLVFNKPCLIRVIEQENDRIYHVILKQEEIDAADIKLFMNSRNSTPRQKDKGQDQRYSFDDIIGESPAIKRVKELAARIAKSNSTVLLTGESGTGKEVFAQAIHELSRRKNQPFVAINCAAIPEELFESELFGYEGGAFSGALKEGKPGKIELAQHGTLFLDEISELPFQTQGKLLRVLQEREVERLGSTGITNVDIRIVAATNRNLEALVKEGKFRQDLFYRLYVFDLVIPPLHQRKEDILLLANYFINHFNEMLGVEVNGIDSELQQRMLTYHWPGNVRELKAIIERGMHLAYGNILTYRDLYMPLNTMDSDEINIETQTKSLEEEVTNAEITAIQRALKETNGDRIAAALKLQIHPASIYRKIAKYKIK